MNKNKWGVVVGRPKKSHWRNSKPDLSNIGKWVIGYKPNGSWSGDVVLFDTRREARKYAKKLNTENWSWRYHAKKYTS